MKFYINDREVEAREGQSILDAALEAGIFIPHLCSHPDLEAKGGCRLCVVEIEGKDKPLPACTTMPSEGMRVSVNGPQADKVRRMSMELILATHPADCTGCPKYGKCELQSMYQYMGVSPERWRKKSRSVANDDSNPLIQHLFTRCIRCGRCIRACQDLRGVKVLDYIKTDAGIRSDALQGTRIIGICMQRNQRRIKAAAAMPERTEDIISVRHAANFSARFPSACNDQRISLISGRSCLNIETSFAAGGSQLRIGEKGSAVFTMNGGSLTANIALELNGSSESTVASYKILRISGKRGLSKGSLLPVIVRG